MNQLLAIAVLLCVNSTLAQPASPLLASQSLLLSEKVIDTTQRAAKNERPLRQDLKLRRPAELFAAKNSGDFEKAAILCLDDLEQSEPGSEREQEVLATLGYLGRYATKPLVDGLHSENAVVRKWCAVELGRHGKAATDALVETARHDKERYVRTAAIDSLGCLCDPKCGRVLIELLNDPEFSVAISALGGLASLNMPETIEPINRFINQEGLDKRLAERGQEVLSELDVATRSLYYCWPTDLARLHQLTIDAETAIGEQFGQEEVDTLTAHLESDNRCISSSCLRALGELRAESAVQAIVKLKRRSPEIHTVLAQIATQEAVNYLLSSLQSGDTSERDLAISGIGNGAGRWAVPLLVELLDAPELRSVDDRVFPEEPDNRQMEGYLGRLPNLNVRFPDGHLSHSAMWHIMRRSGSDVSSVNIAFGDTYDVDKEIEQFKAWWSLHSAEFLDHKLVKAPVLTVAVFSWSS